MLRLCSLVLSFFAQVLLRKRLFIANFVLLQLPETILALHQCNCKRPGFFNNVFLSIVIHCHFSDIEVSFDYFKFLLFSCISRSDNKIVRRMPKRKFNGLTIKLVHAAWQETHAVLPNSFSSFEAATRALRSATSSALLPIPSIVDGFSSEW